MRPTHHAAPRSLCALAVLLLGLAGGCSSAYYSTMESFGVHKREILSDRVQDGRDDQEAAKKQFQSTLAAFREVTGWDSGKLGQAYDRLADELESCQSRADAVHDRIGSIENVAGALFGEWAAEAKQYTDQNLRSKSEAMLRDTKQRYGQLLGAMKKAEASMAPVLAAFRDQVLFLKHNLNAQAIASLQTNVDALQSDINKLVADMEASISEADTFIKSLG